MCRKMATWFIGILVSFSLTALAEEQKSEESRMPSESEDKWGEEKAARPVEMVFREPTPGGAYGILFVSSGKIGNTAGTLLGVRGAWMFSKSWGVGISAKTLNSQFDDNLPDDYSLVYAYNGITLEYTWDPHRLLHVNTVLLAGEGRIALDDQYGRKDQNRDYFPIVELEINAEWNLTPYARFLLGVSQRWVSDIAMAGFNSKDFMHPQAHVGLKLGMF